MSNRNYYQNFFSDPSIGYTQRDVEKLDNTTGFMNTGFIGGVRAGARFTYNSDEMILYRNSLDYEYNTLIDRIPDEERDIFERAYKTFRDNRERGELLDNIQGDTEQSRLRGVEETMGAINKPIGKFLTNAITDPFKGTDSVLARFAHNKLRGSDEPINLSSDEAFEILNDFRERYDSPFRTEEDIIEHMRQEYAREEERFSSIVDNAPVRGFIGSFVGGMAADPILAVNRAFNDQEYVHAMSYVIPVGAPLRGLSTAAKATSRFGTGFALNAGTEAYLQMEYVQDFQNIVLENEDYGTKDIVINTLISGVAGGVFSAGLPFTLERIRKPQLINDAEMVIDDILMREQISIERGLIDNNRDILNQTRESEINLEVERLNNYYDDGVRALNAERENVIQNTRQSFLDLSVDNNRQSNYIREAKFNAGKNTTQRFDKLLSKNENNRKRLNQKRNTADSKINGYNREVDFLIEKARNINSLKRSDYEASYNNIKSEISKLEKLYKTEISQLKRTGTEILDDMKLVKESFKVQGSNRGLKGQQLTDFIDNRMSEKFGVQGRSSDNNMRVVANELSRDINLKLEDYHLGKLNELRTEAQISKLNKFKSEVNGNYNQFKSTGQLSDISDNNREVIDFINRLSDEDNIDNLPDSLIRARQLINEPDPRLTKDINNAIHQKNMKESVNDVYSDNSTRLFEQARQNELLIRFAKNEAGDLKELNSNNLISGLKNYLDNIMLNNSKRKLNEIEQRYTMSEREFFKSYRPELERLIDSGLSYRELESSISRRVQEYNNELYNGSMLDNINKRVSEGLDQTIRTNIEAQLNENERTMLDDYERIINTTDETKARMLDQEIEVMTGERESGMSTYRNEAQRLKQEREQLESVLTCMIN